MFNRIVCVALAAMSAGCSAIGRPSVRDVKVRVTGLDLQGASMAFDVDVNNPYPVSIPNSNFNYAIEIENREFVKSDAPVTAEFPARGVGTATLPVRFSYLDLWKTFASLGDAPEIRYKLRAALLVSALGQTHELPVSHDGTIPVLRLPTFTPGTPDFSDISFSGAAVRVPVEVSNPNAFPLDVGELGYELALGDAQAASLSAKTIAPVAARGAGNITLTGRISAGGAVRKLMSGGGLGAIRLRPIGAMKTPYGPVRLGG